jgi:hypothetical protein
MSRQGNGVYVLPPGNPVVTGTQITASWANTTLDDIAAALTGSLAADGQTAALANMAMGGFRHTNVGKATATTSYARADQVQQGELLIVLSGAMPAQDQYVGTLPLGATTFTQWQMIFYVAPASNVGAMTLNINGAGAKNIVHADSSPSVLGDFIAGTMYGLTWDGSAWRFVNASSDYAALDARYLRLTGGAMTGVLQVVTPVGNSDATTKVYVDAGDATKLNLSGGTMTGSLTLSGDPITALQAATRQFVLASVIGSVAGVSSFNTRSGAVTLVSADVTDALTFTPYSNTNPAGFITGITGAQVNSALGFVPYNSAGGTISGNVTLGGGITGNRYAQTLFTGTLGTTNVLDFNQGQVQSFTFTAPVVAITAINNVPVGSSMRLVMHIPNAGVGTNISVTWPAGTPVYWDEAIGNPTFLAFTSVTISIVRVTAGVFMGSWFKTSPIAP